MQRHLHDHLTRLVSLAALALVAGCGERVGADVGAGVPFPRANNTLIVVTNAETPQYSYRDKESGEVVGIELDIVRAAAAKLGCQIETRITKFENLLFAVKSGEADMAVSVISITEPRKVDVDFSIPYAVDGGKFLYRAGEPMPTMIRAEKLRIGVVEATTYDRYLCSHGIDPVRFFSQMDAIEALKDKRIDALMNDGIVVMTEAEQSNGMFAASRFETRELFGIAVRKGLPELKAALDETILERRGAK